jgi:hypothetical protein
MFGKKIKTPQHYRWGVSKVKDSSDENVSFVWQIL